MTDPPHRPLRVGAWVAVSSKRQAADDKVSLEDQERLAREFATAVNGELASVYRVPGHSRDYWSWYEIEQEVDAYKSLREDLQAHRLDVVWVFDADRAGRDPALAQQMYSLCRRNGAELYCSTMPHPVGQQTAGHRYGFSFQATRSGEEQDARRYKLRSGMRGRIGKRGLMANRPPIGYAMVRDERGQVTGYEFTPDIAAVDRMTDLFLAGHSYCAIARLMNESPYRPRDAGIWHHTTVRYILSNDLYAGRPKWGPWTYDGDSPSFPPRWDADTYARIVRERQRRVKAPYVRAGAGAYTGVAFCGRCDWRMVYHRVKNDYHHTGAIKPIGPYTYLICGRYNRGLGECHCNYIAEHRVTEAIAAHLDRLKDPAVLEAALALLDLNTAGDDRSELARLSALIADLEQQRARLALALAAGQMDAAMYRVTDDGLLSRLHAARAEAGDVAAQIEARPDPYERAALLAQAAAIFALRVSLDEPAAVSALLQGAGIRVLIEDGEIAQVLPAW